jgi:hypothetical protein
MIKKYKDFSVNEAKATEDEEYDVRQICADLVENHGIEIEISTRFANTGGASSDSPNTDFKFPFISIYLTARKDGKEEVEEQRALDLISAIYECVGKLSELGEATVKKIETMNYVSELGSKKYNQEKVIIYVKLEEEAEVSDKQGFYDFTEKTRSAFNNHSNKVTKAYSVEIGNGLVTLVPKEDLIFHPPLTAVKSFLRSKFSPDHNTYGFNMLREYTYVIQSQDGKIKIDYEGYYNLARGRRQGELVK